MRNAVALSMMGQGLGWWPARLKCPPGFAPGFDPANPNEPTCIEKVGIVPQPVVPGTLLTVPVSGPDSPFPGITGSPVPGAPGLLIQPSWGGAFVARMAGRGENRRRMGWWPSRLKCPPGFAPGYDPANPNEPSCIEKVGIVPQPVVPGTLLNVNVSAPGSSYPGITPSPVPGSPGLLIQPGGRGDVGTFAPESAARLLRLAEAAKRIVDDAVESGDKSGASRADRAAADAVRECVGSLSAAAGPFEDVVSELRAAARDGRVARMTPAQAAAIEAFSDCAQKAQDARG